jgi:dihydroorotase
LCLLDWLLILTQVILKDRFSHLMNVYLTVNFTPKPISKQVNKIGIVKFSAFLNLTNIRS